MFRKLSDMHRDPSSTNSTADTNTTAQPTAESKEPTITVILNLEGTIPDVINELQKRIAGLQNIQMMIDATNNMVSLLNKANEAAESMARETVLRILKDELAKEQASAAEDSAENETSEAKAGQESDDTDSDDTDEEMFKKVLEKIQDAFEQAEKNAHKHHNDEDSIRADIEGMGLHGFFGGAGTSLRTSTPASDKRKKGEHVPPNELTQKAESSSGQEEKSSNNDETPPPSLSPKRQ